MYKTQIQFECVYWHNRHICRFLIAHRWRRQCFCVTQPTIECSFDVSNKFTQIIIVIHSNLNSHQYTSRKSFNALRRCIHSRFQFMVHSFSASMLSAHHLVHLVKCYFNFSVVVNIGMSSEHIYTVSRNCILDVNRLAAYTHIKNIIAVVGFRMKRKEQGAKTKLVNVITRACQPLVRISCVTLLFMVMLLVLSHHSETLFHFLLLSFSRFKTQMAHKFINEWFGTHKMEEQNSVINNARPINFSTKSLFNGGPFRIANDVFKVMIAL